MPLDFPHGHQDHDAPTFWLLLYTALPQGLIHLNEKRSSRREGSNGSVC